MIRSSFLACAAACALVLGCDDEPADPDAGTADASAAVDSGTVADAGLDAGTLTDAGLDASAVADAGTPTDGGAAETDVTLTYDGHGEPLERAVFGYEREGGEIAGLYFELYRGGAEGCPTESSPSPDQTLIVSGFRGADPATQTYEDGVRVVFFDFEGLFYDALVPVTASEVRLALTAHEDATAEVELEATLQTETDGGVIEGSAVGTFVATHCDSLDGEI